MDKSARIDEFLRYGGNELFSSLMGDDTKRSEGLDRFVQLLQSYSDSCRHIRGRSAAYRFMLRKAQGNGWLGRGSKDLKSHRLTAEEREHIMKRLDEYISSGGRNLRVAKRIIGIAAAILAVGLFVFAVVRYAMSDEYQRMMDSYYEEQVGSYAAGG